MAERPGLVSRFINQIPQGAAYLPDASLNAIPQIGYAVGQGILNDTDSGEPDLPDYSQLGIPKDVFEHVLSKIGAIRNMPAPATTAEKIADNLGNAAGGMIVPGAIAARGAGSAGEALARNASPLMGLAAQSVAQPFISQAFPDNKLAQVLLNTGALAAGAYAGGKLAPNAAQDIQGSEMSSYPDIKNPMTEQVHELEEYRNANRPQDNYIYVMQKGKPLTSSPENAIAEKGGFDPEMDTIGENGPTYFKDQKDLHNKLGNSLQQSYIQKVLDSKYQPSINDANYIMGELLKNKIGDGRFDSGAAPATTDILNSISQWVSQDNPLDYISEDGGQSNPFLNRSLMQDYLNKIKGNK